MRHKLLPVVLSLIAGSADVISFLGLGGLFTAHITGNLVILAAHIVACQSASIALLLSVPMFMLSLGLTSVLAAGVERAGRSSLAFLLLLQFVLLAASFVLCVVAGPRADPKTAIAIVAGMLGVSALAVQNALVQISLADVPSTAVVTTNLTRLTMDLGDILLKRDSADVAAARRRAHHTWPVIVGFTAGAALGAWCFANVGLWSLAMPTALALLAFFLGLQAGSVRAE